MADAAKSAWLKEESEIRSGGVNHAGALTLFTEIGIVGGTFGDK